MTMMKQYPWKVDPLTAENAGNGLIKGYCCTFLIPDYWDCGSFHPQDRCELPGKVFRARAGGKGGPAYVYMSPCFWGEITQYTTADSNLYSAWKGKEPETGVASGKYMDVRAADGLWEVCLKKDGEAAANWQVSVLRDGATVIETLPAAADKTGDHEVHVTMTPTSVAVNADGRELGEFAHDPYPDKFEIHFGCGQPVADGPEVMTEYRYAFVNSFPYPDGSMAIPDGPEDLKPADAALCYLVGKATPEQPKHSGGGMIELNDGSLMLMWARSYTRESWDWSPSVLDAKLSRDGGMNWGEPWTVKQDSPEENVHSVCLGRAVNGDLLLVYCLKLDTVDKKGMVVQRSRDEGRTWSQPEAISPDNGNLQYANNASLRRLDSGRFVLAIREYVIEQDGDRQHMIRMPYALYSDDDGNSWKAGSHVPPADISEQHRRDQNLNEPSIAQLADGRLLMTMRTVAGGQFFSYSEDQGESWSKPYLSPLVGTCSPATIDRIPSTGDILAIFTYGYSGRTPLMSTVSSDGGKTWKNMKFVEESQYHDYGYTSITFVQDRVYLLYSHYTGFPALKRFEGDPDYSDLRLTVLPVDWFYRKADSQ